MVCLQQQKAIDTSGQYRFASVTLGNASMTSRGVAVWNKMRILEGYFLPTASHRYILRHENLCADCGRIQKNAQSISLRHEEFSKHISSYSYPYRKASTCGIMVIKMRGEEGVKTEGMVLPNRKNEIHHFQLLPFSLSEYIKDRVK